MQPQWAAACHSCQWTMLVQAEVNYVPMHDRQHGHALGHNDGWWVNGHDGHGLFLYGGDGQHWGDELLQPSMLHFIFWLLYNFFFNHVIFCHVTPHMTHSTHLHSHMTHCVSHMSHPFISDSPVYILMAQVIVCFTFISMTHSDSLWVTFSLSLWLTWESLYYDLILLYCGLIIRPSVVVLKSSILGSL